MTRSSATVPTRIVTSLFVSVIFFRFLGRADAVEATRDDKGNEQIARLINALGDADFKTRGSAHAELLTLGETARDQLRRALESDTLPEVCCRAQRMLEALDRIKRNLGGMHVIGLYEASFRQHFRLVEPWGRGIDSGA